MVEEKICSHCKYWELIGGDPDNGFCINDIQHHLLSGDPLESLKRTVDESCEHFRRED